MDVLYIGLQSQPLFRFGVSPNKLMDYMMAARPVVCAIAGGNDPVDEAGCGLTIAPQDGAALAAAIRYMRQLAPEERERMGRMWACVCRAQPPLRRAGAALSRRSQGTVR